MNNFKLLITSVSMREEADDSYNDGNSYNSSTGVVTIGRKVAQKYCNGCGASWRCYASYDVYLCYI